MIANAGPSVCWKRHHFIEVWSSDTTDHWLQITLYCMLRWTPENGFSFLVAKTQCAHFTYLWCSHQVPGSSLWQQALVRTSRGWLTAERKQSVNSFCHRIRRTEILYVESGESPVSLHSNILCCGAVFHRELCNSLLTYSCVFFPASSTGQCLFAVFDSSDTREMWHLPTCTTDVSVIYTGTSMSRALVWGPCFFLTSTVWEHLILLKCFHRFKLSRSFSTTGVNIVSFAWTLWKFCAVALHTFPLSLT